MDLSRRLEVAGKTIVFWSQGKAAPRPFYADALVKLLDETPPHERRRQRIEGTAQAIKALRDIGWTQRAIARRIGVGPDALRRWEKGLGAPPALIDGMLHDMMDERPPMKRHILLLNVITDKSEDGVYEGAYRALARTMGLSINGVADGVRRLEEKGYLIRLESDPGKPARWRIMASGEPNRRPENSVEKSLGYDAGCERQGAFSFSLKDSVARAMGYDDYAGLELYQKRYVLRRIEETNEDELRVAAETGAARGQSWGRYQVAVQAINDQHRQDMRDLIAHVVANPREDEWWIKSQYYNYRAKARMAKEQAANAYGIDFEDRKPATGNERILDGWYRLAEQEEARQGAFDARRLSEQRERYLTWLTASQRSYLMRNINLDWLAPLRPEQRMFAQWLYGHARDEYDNIRESMAERQRNDTNRC